jgi:hypothetical protein
VFINKNNKNKGILLLKKICINIKNLLVKPDNGGIPANDKKTKTKDIEINCKLYAYFNSLRVFKIFVLKRKKIKKIFSITITYTIIFKKITEKLYSLKSSKILL